jgi:hypothetical protein
VTVSARGVPADMARRWHDGHRLCVMHCRRGGLESADVPRRLYPAHLDRCQPGEARRYVSLPGVGQHPGEWHNRSVACETARSPTAVADVNLDDYLLGVGFESDPFASTNAESEDLLQEYFVPRPTLRRCLASPRTPNQTLYLHRVGAVRPHRDE